MEWWTSRRTRADRCAERGRVVARLRRGRREFVASFRMKFSPNAPRDGSGRVKALRQDSQCSAGSTHTALSAPPWLTRSARSSPSSPVRPRLSGPRWSEMSFIRISDAALLFRRRHSAHAVGNYSARNDPSDSFFRVVPASGPVGVGDAGFEQLLGHRSHRHGGLGSGSPAEVGEGALAHRAAEEAGEDLAVDEFSARRKVFGLNSYHSTRA